MNDSRSNFLSIFLLQFPFLSLLFYYIMTYVLLLSPFPRMLNAYIA